MLLAAVPRPACCSYSASADSRRRGFRAQPQRRVFYWAASRATLSEFAHWLCIGACLSVNDRNTQFYRLARRLRAAVARDHADTISGGKGLRTGSGLSLASMRLSVRMCGENGPRSFSTISRSSLITIAIRRNVAIPTRRDQEKQILCRGDRSRGEMFGVGGTTLPPSLIHAQQLTHNGYHPQLRS
jgi:hypothetical protein